MFAAFDSKDVSALAAFMTDDVRLRLGNAEPVQGKSAFVEAVNAFLASVAAFRHEVLSAWSDGDALIAEFDVRYTRLDGGEVTLPCCNVFRLREGLVAEYRSYIDATPVYSRRGCERCWGHRPAGRGPLRGDAIATGASNRWPVIVIVCVPSSRSWRQPGAGGRQISTSVNDQRRSPVIRSNRGGRRLPRSPTAHQQRSRRA